jgi:hypothetical protein
MVRSLRCVDAVPSLTRLSFVSSHHRGRSGDKPSAAMDRHPAWPPASRLWAGLPSVPRALYARGTEPAVWTGCGRAEMGGRPRARTVVLPVWAAMNVLEAAATVMACRPDSGAAAQVRLYAEAAACQGARPMVARGNPRDGVPVGGPVALGRQRPQCAGSPGLGSREGKLAWSSPAKYASSCHR